MLTRAGPEPANLFADYSNNRWMILLEARRLAGLLVEACDLSRSYWEDPSFREVDLGVA